MRGRAEVLKFRGPRSLVWLLPFLLIAVAGFLGRPYQRGAGVNARLAGESRGGPTLLEVVSRHPHFAVGFRNVLADFVWLEAVQVSGSRKMKPGDYDRLYDLLSTVVRFDPRFAVPYLLCGIVLGDSPGHAGAALDLLARG